MTNIQKRVQQFNSERIPTIVRYKYHYMCKNIFRFYRATNHLFYEDLGTQTLPPSPVGWICGDLHLENFGSYRGNNGLVYFDLNDFDEALLAPVTWELTRLVSSIFIAFESLHIDEERAQRMAQLYMKSYAATLASGKADFVEASTATGIICDFLQAAAKRKQKSILEKRTVANSKILLEHDGHLQLDKFSKKEIMEHIANWLKNDDNSPYNYKVKDASFRLAGTSSLGINRYEILVESTNGHGKQFLLLDMKQAMPSSVAVFSKTKQPHWKNEAERICFVQQLMQNRIPSLLSTTIFNEMPYIIQEMQPVKDSINFKLIKKNYRGMCEVISTMGMLTASSQLRAAGRIGSANADALVTFGKSTDWQGPLLNIALKMANKTKTYFEAFKQLQEESKLQNDEAVRNL